MEQSFTVLWGVMSSVSHGRRLIAPSGPPGLCCGWTAAASQQMHAFPTVQRTTHFSGDHILKHVSHPHKGRVQKGRTRDCRPRWSIGNCSTWGKCSPAPTRKSQWEWGLAGRTHTHGQLLLWGIRPALYLGSSETCFSWNSLTLDWGSKCLLSIFNFLKSVLNHPSMECNQFNHFPHGTVTSFSWV